MILIIEQLKELIKSYTVAVVIAEGSGSDTDRDVALDLLDQINKIRLGLAINAEMNECYWEQKNIPAAANANIIQNSYFSKNDIAYTVKRFIMAFLNTVTVSLLNQGEKQRTITREPTVWQQLASQRQDFTAIGQVPLMDLPEILRFAENQALNIAIQGQTSATQLYIHGATLKGTLEEVTVNGIRREFLDENGDTLYLPESQLVPVEFACNRPARQSRNIYD